MGVFPTEKYATDRGRSCHRGGADPFLTLRPHRWARPPTEPAMDDLTAQERELIMTLRHLRSFTVIFHRNARWRIVVSDDDAGRTNTGEGEDFGKAWDGLNGKR